MNRCSTAFQDPGMDGTNLTELPSTSLVFVNWMDTHGMLRRDLAKHTAWSCVRRPPIEFDSREHLCARSPSGGTLEIFQLLRQHRRSGTCVNIRLPEGHSDAVRVLTN